MFKPEQPRIEIFNGRRLDEIYRQITQAFIDNNLRLLLDIDGTLSNFVRDPLKAFVDTNIVYLIYQLEKAKPGTVTFVTGRPRHEVLNLFNFADGRNLFEVLKEETNRRPNMICNHGKVAFFGEEEIEYTMTDAQKSFLKTAKERAVEKVLAFYDQQAVFPDMISNESGIKVSFGENDPGYLLEIKKDHRGELASFAFHWRILQSLPEAQRQTVIDAFRKIAQEFGKEYNEHVDNPPVAIEGEKDKAPCRYFNLSENSDCVAEFCPSDAHLNKGTMVLRCADRIKGGHADALCIAIGDSVPGTDTELLKAAITLNGLAFNVRHSDSTKPANDPKERGFTGTLHSVSEGLDEKGKPAANQANATVEFFQNSGLLKHCRELSAAQIVATSQEQTPRVSYMSNN